MPRRNHAPKHTPYQFMNACGTKRQFKSAAAAAIAADDQMLVSPAVTLETYRCHLCGKWHLTSKPKN